MGLANSIVKDLRSVLRINQKIEVYFDHPEFMEEYFSRLEKISRRGLGIPTPTPGLVPPKTHCWVYFVYKDQRYGFETTVNGYEGDDTVLMTLSLPKEILRLQRRKYFRVPVELPVTCRIFGPSVKLQKNTMLGTIKNICSGGILMMTDQEIPPGSELILVFSFIKEIDLRDIRARIVRAAVVKKRRRDTLYEYGVEFHDIHGRLRDTIMRFVFTRQIELNRSKRMKSPASLTKNL